MECMRLGKQFETRNEFFHALYGLCGADVRGTSALTAVMFIFAKCNKDVKFDKFDNFVLKSILKDSFKLQTCEEAGIKKPDINKLKIDDSGNLIPLAIVSDVIHLCDENKLDNIKEYLGKESICAKWTSVNLRKSLVLYTLADLTY